jgi:hypothetical protein
MRKFYRYVCVAAVIVVLFMCFVDVSYLVQPVQEAIYSQAVSSAATVISEDSLLCQTIGANDQSFQKVWENTKETIAAVSLLKANWIHDLRTNPSFTNWVQESMSYFTYSRLQRSSIARPLDQFRTFGRIHSILENKLTNPDTAPPLRIVVFGGSVTAGHQCLVNIFDFQVKRQGRDDAVHAAVHMCAWPGRLQDMLDEILGKGVVEIINMSVGGASSDMSTVAMEFGLIPGSSPDIVVWDHGSNDAAEYLDAPKLFTKKLQPFYQAARNLPNSCNLTDPPLVIFLDTLLGDTLKFPNIYQSLTTSEAVWKIVTWYHNTWGISYANVVRPHVLSNLQSKEDIFPLLGSKGLFVHPGMMFHITVAWVFVFNILYALHDNCIERTNALTSLKPTKSSDTKTAVRQTIDHLDGVHIPELTDNLKILDVQAEWKGRIPDEQDIELCLEKQSVANSSTEKATPHSTSKCFYVWMVNRVAKVTTTDHVNQVLQPYLVGNEGWQASGFPVQQPRTGWFAEEGRDSWFELAFEGLPISVQSLTVVYMKSYSEKWYNATVQIDCSIGASMNHNSSREDFPVSSAESLRYHLTGYHVEKTSVLIPEKLQLPSQNRNSGDTLHLKFKLIEGETFKITGMALC